MSRLKSKVSKRLSGGKTNSFQGKNSHQFWTFRPRLQNQGIILNSILDVYNIDYYNIIVNDMRDLITQSVQNHGFNDGSDRYKIIQSYTIALIEGRNPDNPGWLATSEKYRVPSKLGKNFCQLIADYFQVTDPSLRAKYYQVILTTLNIVRMVEGLVDADLRSVTDKAKQIDQVLLDSFGDFTHRMLEKDRIKDRNIPNLFDIRFNIKKNGPNGVPKVESAIQEAHCLINSSLKRPFAVICNELKCDYLFDYLNILVGDGNSVNNQPVVSDKLKSNSHDTRLRVLANIPDRGFKTRMVAIVDFWTQLILEPFRSTVQSVIEKRYQNFDFRLDQDLGVAKMVDFQKRCLLNESINFKGQEIVLDAKHLKFYDIKSWTDKLHRDLQKQVVASLFSKRFAEAWGQLVVHCSWYHPKSGRTIKYGQGQGMGTNGSFDVATLTDHLLIEYLDSTVYDGLIHHIGGYGKVGDDLWIYDPEESIPELYEKINLPINFSKSKTFCTIGSIAEFCARTFLNGTDVSRISPNIISKSKDFRHIPLLLGLCSSRGIQLDATFFPTLNNIVKGTEISYLDKLQDWIISYILISQVEQGSTWKELTLDYLVAGNWIKGDLVSQVFEDPNLLSRLMIGYSIMTILESKEDLEDKLFDIVDAMDDYGDEIIRLCEPDVNLFNVSDPLYELANEATDGNVLTPKQIVVFGRYKDQRVNIQDKLFEFTTELSFADNPKAIYEYSKAISELANKSCYDCGNLKYNTDQVIGRQFKIVKVFGTMSDDYKIINGISREQLRSLLQDLQYDEIAEKWEGCMPTLSVS